MKSRILLIAAALAVSCTSIRTPDIARITDGATRTNCSWGHVELQPGEEKTLCEIKGPGALTYFYITDGPEFITDEALVLRFYWDGNDLQGRPCIQGSYTYIIRYRNSLEPTMTQELTGTITLLR